MFWSFTRMQKMQKLVMQMTRQLIMFWSFSKTKMLKRKGKKITAYHALLVSNRNILFHNSTSYYCGHLPNKLLFMTWPSTSLSSSTSTDVLDTSVMLPKFVNLLTSCFCTRTSFCLGLFSGTF